MTGPARAPVGPELPTEEVAAWWSGQLRRSGRLAVWLSGRSSPQHTALSPAQRELLALTEPAGFAVVDRGYPFSSRANWTPSDIVTASARNTGQYLRLRLHPGEATLAAQYLAPLAAAERLLLICGSLGHELLAAAISAGLRLPRRSFVIALGPVGRPLPEPIPTWVAQDPQDLISRAGYRGSVQARPHCGHLGYAADIEVRRQVTERAGADW
jgi:hypothetical protein